MKFFSDHNQRNAIIFMAPFIILMSVFMVSVFISGFFTSLTNAQGINPGSYVGLENFKYILNERSFWKAVYVSVKLTIISLLIQIPVSFLLSLWIDSVPFKKMQGLLKAAFFIPSLINTIIAGIMFRFLFTGERCIANIILGFFNLSSKLDWLLDPELAFPLLVIVSFWQCIGFQIIYFSSYHKTINKTIYEAARIDGATRFQLLRKITVPLMKPAIIFIAITSAVSSLMLYDLIMALFPYGAHENAQTVIYYIYARSFGYSLEMGVASAAGWIAFFIILSVSLLQLRFLGLGENHEN